MNDFQLGFDFRYASCTALLTGLILSRGECVMCSIRSHYPERASALDYKGAAILRFCHRDVIFDLFIEIRFFCI